eukprot:TRINITY_DN3183_c0_g1_i2.p1 TRINITY_DN3183_c0_g1~~TRINITY_DN3183_c0_g1_i2.p1  ORF type:complete len:679 (+),score=102.82 TRINITY_DN3183_c0_g1_i2:57-2093(+)
MEEGVAVRVRDKAALLLSGLRGEFFSLDVPHIVSTLKEIIGLTKRARDVLDAADERRVVINLVCDKIASAMKMLMGVVGRVRSQGGLLDEPTLQNFEMSRDEMCKCVVQLLKLVTTIEKEYLENQQALQWEENSRQMMEAAEELERERLIAERQEQIEREREERARKESERIEQLAREKEAASNRPSPTVTPEQPRSSPLVRVKTDETGSSIYRQQQIKRQENALAKALQADKPVADGISPKQGTVDPRARWEPEGKKSKANKNKKKKSQKFGKGADEKEWEDEILKREQEQKKREETLKEKEKWLRKKQEEIEKKRKDMSRESSSNDLSQYSSLVQPAALTVSQRRNTSKIPGQLSRAPTLRKILRVPQTRTMLLKSLETNPIGDAVNDIRFWEVIFEFTHIYSRQPDIMKTTQFQTNARKIVEKFLRPGAPHHVHVPSEILERLQQCDQFGMTSFEESQAYIFKKLLEAPGMLETFLGSAEWQAFQDNGGLRTGSDGGYISMEKVVSRMKDSRWGISLRDDSSFSGADAVSWILKRVNINDREEAAKLGQQMMLAGYLQRGKRENSTGSGTLPFRDSAEFFYTFKEGCRSVEEIISSGEMNESEYLRLVAHMLGLEKEHEAYLLRLFGLLDMKSKDAHLKTINDFRSESDFRSFEGVCIQFSIPKLTTCLFPCFPL